MLWVEHARKTETLKPREIVIICKITVEDSKTYTHKRSRSPGEPFNPMGLREGYLIIIGNRTIYHIGDTDFIPEMRQLNKVHVELSPSGDTYTIDIRRWQKRF